MKSLISAACPTVGIAVHALVGEKSAEGIPAAVIVQFLRDAAAAVVDVLRLIMI
jgi:hypothetical protein